MLFCISVILFFMVVRMISFFFSYCLIDSVCLLLLFVCLFSGLWNVAYVGR
jgi:hypothetical protein